MKNKSLKATQKLLVLTSQNLQVHPDARAALMVWQCKGANDDVMLGLPKNMNWIDASYESK